MKIPPLLFRVGTFLEWRESQLKHFWNAVHHSQWQRPLAWKRDLQQLAWHHIPLDRVLCEECMSPGVLVKVIEDLTHEKRLSRIAANMLEASLLKHTDHTGRWKEQPPEPRVVVFSPEIAAWIGHYWR